MLSRRSLWAIPLLSALTAIAAIGQERSIPFDSTGRVDEIDAELEAKLGLFTEYRHFTWAKLHGLPDSTYALDVRHATPGFTVVTRTILTPPELADLRARVDAAMRSLPPEALPAGDDFSDSSRDGRQILVTGTTIGAICMYGIAIPVTLGADAAVGIPIYGATVGAGYLIPHLLTRNGTVSPGAARFAVDAAVVGFLQGGLVNTMINGREVSFRGSMGWGTAMGIATEVGGYYLGNHLGMGEGRGEVTAVGGMFGFGLGITCVGIANLYAPGRERTGAALALLGSELGYVGGYALGGMTNYTVGDARVLLATGVLGAYLPLAVIGLVNRSAPEIALAAPITGSLIGLGIGHMMVRNRDFSPSQGTIVALGTVGGMALGFLGGRAITGGKSDYDKLTGAIAGSALGGIAGYSVFMASFSGNADDGKTGSLINIRVAPEGAMAFALRDRLHLPDGATVPLFQMNGSF